MKQAPLNYTYRNPKVRLAMRLFDALGGLVIHPHFRPTGTPQRICLIILHQIGDMVIAMPSIQAVRAMYPEAEITVIAGAAPAALLQSSQIPEKIIVFNAIWQKAVQRFERKDGQSDWRQLAALITSVQADACLVFFPDLLVNRAVAKARVSCSIGFSNAGGGFWLTDALPMPQQGHQAERDYALVQRLGACFSTPVPELAYPFLPVHTSVQAALAENPDMKAITGKKPVVALHPFTESSKMWPAEYWQELIMSIDPDKVTLAVIGGAKDALPFTEGYLNFCGKLDLGATAAFLHEAALFVGVDSGPGHIAAAVGCPVVSIFASAHDPAQWAPWGEKVTVLYKEVEDREKYPLEARSLPEGTVGNPYIDGIKPEEVLQAMNRLLSFDCRK